MWVRIEEDFYGNRKVLAVSAETVGVFVLSLSWCNHQKTDGFIWRPALPFIKAKPRNIRELVKVEMWLPVKDGWEIHDYAEYQRTAAFWEDLAAKKADAGRKGAAARWNGSSHGSSYGKTDGRPEP